MDVKIFRESLNLTQQEMAALLGVTQPSWNYYETGKREIPAYIQREIEFFQALSKRSQQVFIHNFAIRRGGSHGKTIWTMGGESKRCP